MIAVLFVGHAYVIAANWQRKLDSLAATGEVKVGLLVPKAWKSKQWGRVFQLKRWSDKITFYAVPAIFKGIEGAYMLEPFSVLRAISEFKPDLIHVEQEVFALSSFELAALRMFHGRPLMFFGWENIDRSRRLALLRKFTTRFVLNSALAVVCGNKDNEILIRKWGYRGPTRLLPQFGVDARPPLAQTADASKRTTFRIAFVGALTYQKGVDILLDALALLRQKGACFRLTVCGVGPMQEALTRKAREIGLQDSVTWMGLVPSSEIPAALADVDALVLPSRTLPHVKEQFGLVLAEAMGMGIPVVGSSSGSIPDVIGRKDLLFPEGEYSRLAMILEQLKENQEWRKEISEYCLSRVQHHFTHEQLRDQLLQLYRELLGASAARYAHC